MRVCVTREIPASALARLAAEHEVALNREDRNLSRDEIIALARGCAGLICTLADPVDSALLEALAPGLRVVSTYAVGVNNIDLACAARLGVKVANTPGVLTDATAEIAVGLMLACARRFAEGDHLTRQGRFAGWAPLFMRGQGVYGAKVGIVGAGRIGLRVARTMALGFGCPVLYHSRREQPEFEALGARRVELDELLARSDFVSLHCPLTEATRHLIDERRLALMKPGACLVNTARGPVVDEAALVRALKDGRIFAAGLDVYEREPALEPGLADLPNTVLLPHLGSATFATREEMGRLCVGAVLDVLAGRTPPNLV
jgi:glyoxylate reductase